MANRLWCLVMTRQRKRCTGHAVRYRTGWRDGYAKHRGSHSSQQTNIEQPSASLVSMLFAMAGALNFQCTQFNTNSPPEPCLIRCLSSILFFKSSRGTHDTGTDSIQQRRPGHKPMTDNKTTNRTSGTPTGPKPVAKAHRSTVFLDTDGRTFGSAARKSSRFMPRTSLAATVRTLVPRSAWNVGVFCFRVWRCDAMRCVRIHRILLAIWAAEWKDALVSLRPCMRCPTGQRYNSCQGVAEELCCLFCSALPVFCAVSKIGFPRRGRKWLRSSPVYHFANLPVNRSVDRLLNHMLHTKPSSCEIDHKPN